MRHLVAGGALLAALFLADSAVAQTRQLSLALDGVSQYLTVPDKTDLENLGSMTIEAWVYPTTFTGFPTIVGNDFQDCYWFGFSESGNPRFYPNGGPYAQAPQTIPLNQWTHVAVAFKSGPDGLITFYINGAEVHNVATSVVGTGSSAGDLRIGADRSGGSPDFFFNGLLDEVRIWNKPLTASFVQAGMFERANNPGLGGGAYAGLLAYWHMDDPWPSVPDRHFDVARGFGQGDNDAFFVNNPGSSPETPPVSYNTAVQFDGIDDYVHAPMPDGFADGITIEAWVCPLSFSGFPTIVGRDYATSFWLGFNTAGQLRFYPTGGGGNYVESTVVMAPGFWRHVAATYRDGVARLYVDGSPAGIFTSVTGPVGENGRDIYIGADNAPGGAAFHMNGIIDHVTITRGELSGVTIRKGMAYTISAPFDMTPDVTGVPRERMEFELSHRAGTGMSGNPRFVQAATPRVAFGVTSPLWETDYTYGFDDHIVGQRSVAASSGSSVHFAQDVTITDVKAFVSVVASDMSTVEILLRHPDLTEITLVAAGDATNSRELHTVFDDNANATLATLWPPFDDVARPSGMLSAFQGKNSMGFWRLQVNGGGEQVGIIAWGISFNGITPLAVGDPAGVARLELAVTGANPITTTGQLAFALPQEGRIRLDLLDVQGRTVHRLACGAFGAGRHLVRWSARELEPGVYFARLTLDSRDTREVKIAVVR